MNLSRYVCVSQICVAVTDLSTIPLPPQDEEYARQLQQELYAISDEPDRGGEVKPITERVSESWYCGIYS